MSTLTDRPYRDKLHTMSLLLVAVGMIVSGYISYAELTRTQVVCTAAGIFNCEAVHNSIYAKLAGINIAYLGFVAYLCLGGLLILEAHIPFVQEYGRTLIFGATLFAFLYAVWLVYAQARLLEAFCIWCMAHEINITLLFGASAVRLWRSMRD